MSAYAQPAHDPTAVVGKRIVAFIIDIVIWSLIFGVAFRLLADSADADLATCTGTCATVGDTVYGVGGVKAALLWLVFFWGYLILLLGLVQGIKGFWIGKAVLGLRVVNTEGQVPGAGKGILRALLLIVDYFFCLLIGLITALTTKNHTRVGDLAAKTFVVATADVGRPPVASVGASAAPYGTPAPAAPYGTPTAATPMAAPYTPPVAEPAAPVAPPAAEPAAAPTGSEPQWDPARNAYIQWDANQGAWLQFDDATQQWRPIDQ